MSRNRLFLYGFLMLLAIGIFFGRPYLENFYTISREKVKEYFPDKIDSIAQTVQKNISAPPPLRSKKEASGTALSRGGVINFTNTERKNNGQKPLKENVELDAAAEKKAQDILAKQYFDHVNPEGKGPDYFVSMAGYGYITIGENLALGNFADDQDLVNAWMASPGHRENMLRPQFQEIGVAVAKGTFEGKLTWVTVQEFGTPLSACPAADDDLKKTIDANRKQIENLLSDIKSKEGQIKKTSSRDSAYGELVKEYNALVDQYNSLATKTKKLIQNYNSQVNQYNDCVKNF